VTVAACSGSGRAPRVNSGTGGQAQQDAAGTAGGPCTGTIGAAGSDQGGATGSAGAPGAGGAQSTGVGGGGQAGGAGGNGGPGGGAGTAPSTAPQPSAGCGKTATETPAQFVKHSLLSSGVSRDFYTYLPVNYDKQKPYRTIFAFHPCGGSGSPGSNVPIQNESKQDAIIIAPQSMGSCYANQMRNSPDVTFFDDTLKYAEANYCVDQSRIFAIGYSAGSWMSIILGCERAGIVRAHAQVSGGLPMFIRPGADCRGNVAALFIHDTLDPQNTYNGGVAARDRVLRVDRCGSATMPWAPAPCEAYQGCKPGFPVVWCATTGKGHDRQDSFAPAAIWKFLSQF
jgi:polyhydroxybutyrate depolymerase